MEEKMQSLNAMAFLLHWEKMRRILGNVLQQDKMKKGGRREAVISDLHYSLHMSEFGGKCVLKQKLFI